LNIEASSELLINKQSTFFTVKSRSGDSDVTTGTGWNKAGWTVSFLVISDFFSSTTSSFVAAGTFRG